ncbi:MAG TPA: hypothetical protein VFW34_08025 [Candidatus Rubrimentiphilum sp.]|nr:hypothetical protein [Candidatus Rubrimentiphilum sp.]
MRAQAVVLIALQLLCSSAAAADQARALYFIDGRQLQTAGSSLKALTIAYERYALSSATSPRYVLSDGAVDIVTHADGSYAVAFLPAGNTVTVPATIVAPASVTLSHPHRLQAKAELTLFGPDAAALIVAAQTWNAIKWRPSNNPLFDTESRNIANYDVYLGMEYLRGKSYYVVTLTPRYFPCLPRCTVAAADWEIRIDAQTFQPGSFRSVG